MPDTPTDPLTAALLRALTTPGRDHDLVNLAQYFALGLSPRLPAPEGA